jgi:hypothetical protein
MSEFLPDQDARKSPIIVVGGLLTGKECLGHYKPALDNNINWNLPPESRSRTLPRCADYTKNIVS